MPSTKKERNANDSFMHWVDRPFQNSWALVGFGSLVIPGLFFWNQPSLVLWLGGMGLFTLLLGLAGKTTLHIASFSERVLVQRSGYWGMLMKTHRVNLSEYTAVELQHYTENQQMNMISISQVRRTRVFDVVFTGPDLPRIHFAEYTDYADAQQALAKVAEGLHLQPLDRYAAARSQLQRRGKMLRQQGRRER